MTATAAQSRAEELLIRQNDEHWSRDPDWKDELLSAIKLVRGHGKDIKRGMSLAMKLSDAIDKAPEPVSYDQLAANGWDMARAVKASGRSVTSAAKKT